MIMAGDGWSTVFLGCELLDELNLVGVAPLLSGDTNCFGAVTPVH